MATSCIIIRVSEVAMFKRISMVIGVLALGMTLAGCDKCGDWYKSQPGLQSCKNAATR